MLQTYVFASRGAMHCAVAAVKQFHNINARPLPPRLCGSTIAMCLMDLRVIPPCRVGYVRRRRGAGGCFLIRWIAVHYHIMN